MQTIEGSNRFNLSDCYRAYGPKYLLILIENIKDEDARSVAIKVFKSKSYREEWYWVNFEELDRLLQGGEREL